MEPKGSQQKEYCLQGAVEEVKNLQEKIHKQKYC